MSPASETWNQWMLGHRPLSRFFQIDRLANLVTQTGTQTSDPFHLPHGRYTIFVEADPPRAARAFELVNDRGFRFYQRWVPDNIANVPVPAVQQELPAGEYRLRIETASPSNAWQAQVILNSMLSWEAVPKPWERTLALPSAVRVANDTSPSFAIGQTGHYAIALSVEGFVPDQRVFPKEFCPFKLALRANDGHRIELAEGGRNTANWPPTPIFLGAGEWTVEMETTCEWWMTIKPMLGTSGGGARWF